jgi:arylformamidase
LYDVSAALTPGLPVWPGQQGLRRRLVLDRAKGDPATVSDLCLGAHSGTHIDAPAHFIVGGGTVASLPLEVLIGPAVVVDLSALPARVSSSDLERCPIPAHTQRLLLRTRNSGWTRDQDFRPGFVALDASAADWCVDNGIRLIGIDYLSIEAFGSEDQGNPVHHRLLRAKVVILEGLELEAIDSGLYQLVALPILAAAAEAAPARVVLTRLAAS